MFDYSEFYKERARLGIVAAEIAVEDSFILAASLAEQFAAEGSGYFPVEDSFLLKQAEGVCFQDFGPFVGIIPCRVASREDMAE